MKSALRLLLAVAVLGALQSSSVGVATASGPSAEDQLVSLVNRERVARGLSPLAVDDGLGQVASDWTGTMATQRCPSGLAHNPDFDTKVPGGWDNLGENVACGGSVKTLFSVLMKSSPHRANILGDFDTVGIGVRVRGGLLWVTQIFANYGVGPSKS
jgi:uncharacterized protein YkwD